MRHMFFCFHCDQVDDCVEMLPCHAVVVVDIPKVLACLLQQCFCDLSDALSGLKRYRFCIAVIIMILIIAIVGRVIVFMAVAAG